LTDSLLYMSDSSDTADIIAGGRSVAVTFLDGSKDTVFVKEYPWYKVSTLAEHYKDDFALVRETCGISQEILETLTLESFQELHVAALKLNLPILNKWGKHQVRVRELQVMRDYALINNTFNSLSQASQNETSATGATGKSI